MPVTGRLSPSAGTQGIDWTPSLLSRVGGRGGFAITAAKSRESMKLDTELQRIAKMARLAGYTQEDLLSLLKRCQRIVEADAMMMADITRHAPLDPKSQAVHDSTEYESEMLARELEALFGPAR